MTIGPTSSEVGHFWCGNLLKSRQMGPPSERTKCNKPLMFKEFVSLRLLLLSKVAIQLCAKSPLLYLGLLWFGYESIER